MLKTSFFLLALTAVVRSASRTTPPSGSVVVSKTPSSGQYSTIQAAINSLSSTSTSAQSIFIYPGNYTEQVIIAARSAPLTIYGYTSDTSSYTGNQVTISHLDSILSGETKDEYTATLQTRTPSFNVYNVNIQNTYGKGSQALALSAYADKQGYYGVALYGYQDTLYSETGNQIYAKCLIQGATDFIFGQHARTWITKSDIRVAGSGCITANGRSSDSDVSYYVIDQSTVAAASGVSVSSGSVYLGRPWSQYARVVVQLTSLSSVINSAGWSVWNSGDERTSDVTFAEYGNTGSGASGTRASFATKLSSAVTISDILGSDYASWVDTAYLSGTTSTTTTTATKSTTTTSSTKSTTTTSSTKTTTTTTKSSTTSASASSSTGEAAHYAQCGGIGYTGPTTCVSPYVCTYSNDWYSQCI